MEAGYIDHLASSSAPKVVDHHQHDLSISMTATVDSNGSLLLGIYVKKERKNQSCLITSKVRNLSRSLLGSSRQFAGFNTDLDMGVVGAIWERATEFFPTLREFSIEDLSERRKVRIGLRPYSK